MSAGGEERPFLDHGGRLEPLGHDAARAVPASVVGGRLAHVAAIGAYASAPAGTPVSTGATHHPEDGRTVAVAMVGDAAFLMEPDELRKLLAAADEKLEREPQHRGNLAIDDTLRTFRQALDAADRLAASMSGRPH